MFPLSFLFAVLILMVNFPLDVFAKVRCTLDIVTLVVPLISEASKEAIKLLTGKLLTESQIQSVSKHVVGKYFADLLPTSENEAEAGERIASARMHITEASNIISSLQGDLERQADQLEFLAKEIETKRVKP
jgi:hypothetical protein